ncbi:SusC/RagA family TonB-linked outer membrane protein [Adhaeribacter aerolatus]|uniref:SusC/RagA family TonB-linked outer membrane protein n=1 Tax=Adhaeribacter aerolatus TaxID=670289 RepID=A0A512AS35_9BACT|nr:TonB-dependent receptor [Adhaeribacter aerolatus]GEO02515.1 SusC/RagA family TonB-linked outer membrane protein [Adhaeribacter aerolatus]
MQKLITQKWLLGWLLVLLLTFCPDRYAAGQSQTIRGRVTDSKGSALPGVTVLVKGTEIGTATDPEGRFGIAAPQAGSTLVFTYVGFEPREVAASGNGEVNVVLQESAKALSEVVVVGYGTQKKVNVTGAVSVVDGEALTKRQVASTSLALQGAAPGVTVTQQSGVPGGDAGAIRIRGIGSINAGSNPLVLVDNVEMSLDAIDPNNIESISVLKDAAAAAIYGSRAANGVILVTTKRGKQGINVSYNAYLAKQTPTDMPEKVNALEHMRYWDVAQVNSKLPPAFTQQIAAYEASGPDNFNRFNTDWQDLVLTNNGMMHNHNLNVSAGTDKVKIFASGTFLDQNGLTANTDYQRTDLRFNTDVAVTKKLSASMDLVLNRSNRLWPGQSNPTAIIRYMLGLPAIVPGRYNSGEWGEGWSNANPAAQAEDGGFNRSITDSRIIKGTLTYKPTDGLELLATYSSNFYTGHQKLFTNQYQIYNAEPSNNTLVFARPWPALNSLTENTSENYQNLFRAQATFTKALDKHNFTVLGGFSTEDFRSTNINVSRQNLLSPDRPYLDSGDPTGQTISGGENRYAMVSAYGRLNYNFDEKYLLELNGRWDASSRFRENNWWALFPSLSVGWRLSQENFWGGLSNIVNDAKIRASYGALGNQAIARSGAQDYYPTYSLFQSGSAYNYYFNNAINAGYALTVAANPDIKWETSKVLDIGTDLAFLNNRLTVTADYFRRDIVDMLQVVPIPNYVGLTAPFVNVGTMRNTGWELGAGWRDKVNDFNYQVQLNLSDVQNEIINNGGTDQISGSKITREGHPYNSYYGYIADGLFQSDEEVKEFNALDGNAATPYLAANTAAGDIKYRDVSGPDGTPDGKIDDKDRVILGNNFPRLEYSLNLAAQYKGLDLTAFFQGVGKRDNYLSGTGSQPFYSASFQGTMFKYQEDFWSPENKGAAYPRLTNNSIPNNYYASSYWIKSSAYLRLKNVVLGYTLPASVTDKIKLKSARVYVSGQNLVTWDKFFPGFDPEQIDTGGEFYPIMRTYTLGVNINL